MVRGKRLWTYGVVMTGVHTKHPVQDNNKLGTSTILVESIIIFRAQYSFSIPSIFLSFLGYHEYFLRLCVMEDPLRARVAPIVHSIGV